MIKLALTVGFLSAAAFFSAGCSSSGSTSDAGTDAGQAVPDAGSVTDAGPSTDAGSTPDAGLTGDAGSVLVRISNFSFVPGNVTVPAGTRITFHNEDQADHTATSEQKPGNFSPGTPDGGFSFDTGNIGAGLSATVQIPMSSNSGAVVPYYCKVHGQGMGEGTVTIR